MGISLAVSAGWYFRLLCLPSTRHNSQPKISELTDHTDEHSAWNVARKLARMIVKANPAALGHQRLS